MVIYYFRFLTFLPSQKFSNPTFLKNYIVYIHYYIVYTDLPTRLQLRKFALSFIHRSDDSAPQLFLPLQL